MKDLEIRGAGNLLGPEQSGHIGAVGFELYSQLLAEAVEGLKLGGKPKTTLPSISTTVDLPLSAHIPEEYVADLSTRLSLYLRLAKVSLPRELDELESELEDRFGPLPDETKDLLYMVRIKLLGSRAGIETISTEDGQVVLRLGVNAQIDRPFLQRSFGNKLKIGTNQLRLDMKRPAKEWKETLEHLLESIAQTKDSSLPRKNQRITLIVPQFVSRVWWHGLLHAHTAVWLRLALMFKRGIVITDVPYQVA